MQKCRNLDMFSLLESSIMMLVEFLRDESSLSSSKLHSNACSRKKSPGEMHKLQLNGVEEKYGKTQAVFG